MIRCILTDIEGTTSSISFVKDVLFPYAAEHLPAFIQQQNHLPEVQTQLNALWQELPGLAQDLDATIEQLLAWIREDRKHTVLKSLQGMIWKRGYESGDYRAHVYPDAVQNLTAWHQQGIDIYIYSSGSIAAQKLFFRYCDAGDVCQLFKGHFDTTTGPKQSPEAYAKIIDQIALPPEEILFLSDVTAELDAAKLHGINTCWLVRPEDCDASEKARNQSPHQSVTSFDDINLAR